MSAVFVCNVFAQDNDGSIQFVNIYK